MRWRSLQDCGSDYCGQSGIYSKDSRLRLWLIIPPSLNSTYQMTRSFTFLETSLIRKTTDYRGYHYIRTVTEFGRRTRRLMSWWQPAVSSGTWNKRGKSQGLGQKPGGMNVNNDLSAGGMSWLGGGRRDGFQALARVACFLGTRSRYRSYCARTRPCPLLHRSQDRNLGLVASTEPIVGGGIIANPDPQIWTRLQRDERLNRPELPDYVKNALTTEDPTRLDSWQDESSWSCGCWNSDHGSRVA